MTDCVGGEPFIDTFFQGVIVGLVIGAPIGPVGLLCLQRTFIHGRLGGFLSGLGAATADAFYAFVASVGLHLISDFLMHYQGVIRLLSGLLLCCVGIYGWFKKPKVITAEIGKRGLTWNYISTILLTISNPINLLGMIALFATIGLTEPRHPMLAVYGVLIGSSAWWFGLAFVSNRILDSISHWGLSWFRWIASTFIIICGLYSVISIAFI